MPKSTSDDAAKNRYVAEFMHYAPHKTKWPDLNQRLAVALSMWEDRKKASKSYGFGHVFGR
jgi:hypothetical protein